MRNAPRRMFAHERVRVQRLGLRTARRHLGIARGHQRLLQPIAHLHQQALGELQASPYALPGLAFVRAAAVECKGLDEPLQTYFANVPGCPFPDSARHPSGGGGVCGSLIDGNFLSTNVSKPLD